MGVNLEVDRFSRDVAADASFRKQIEALGSDVAAVVALARSKGYGITLEDMEKGELSDEQLDAVAGGAEPALANYSPPRNLNLDRERRFGAGR